MNLEQLNTIFKTVKEQQLSGRYITNQMIENCLKNYPESMISVIGHSVKNRPIYSLKFGTGKTKVLLWSQMHGNESTTTKALFDCFNLFFKVDEISKSILDTCTLLIIPILNPDGAENYTRVNANGVDLNRDAQNLSQPESKVLRNLFDSFQPDYCFNLHGQRTIFGTGKSGVPATLSFLSPSQNQQRTLSKNRRQAMAIIAEINDTLQPELPNGIGRYDDGFNLNCVGDTFQNFGVPTLLYEAGHFKNDYNREEVRRFIFIALLKGLSVIAEGFDIEKHVDYFEIPENEKCFFDIIIRNVKRENREDIVDLAFQFEERLVGDHIAFVPKFEKLIENGRFFGHREIDAKESNVKTSENSELKVTNEIDFVFINNEKIALKPD